MSNYPFEYDTIMSHIDDLKQEIDYLKKENVELTNELYAVQNRIDAILYNSIDALKKLNFNGEQDGTIGFS
jgi:predicted  nucleic acid-binding Zn-ribbon protein